MESIYTGINNAKDGRISSIFKMCDVRWLDLEPSQQIININTEEDLSAYLIPSEKQADV